MTRWHWCYDMMVSIIQVEENKFMISTTDPQNPHSTFTSTTVHDSFESAKETMMSLFKQSESHVPALPEKKKKRRPRRKKETKNQPEAEPAPEEDKEPS